jgi:hypothetical protein
VSEEADVRQGRARGTRRLTVRARLVGEHRGGPRLSRHTRDAPSAQGQRSQDRRGRREPHGSLAFVHRLDRLAARRRAERDRRSARDDDPERDLIVVRKHPRRSPVCPAATNGASASAMMPIDVFVIVGCLRSRRAHDQSMARARAGGRALRGESERSRSSCGHEWQVVAAGLDVTA